MISAIAIIGGGPVGAVVASLLARSGFAVTVVQRPGSGRYKAGETLPPVANSLLQRLGISDLLKQGPHLICPGNQSAFGSEQLVDLDFIFSSNGQGWHLDRLYFERQLLRLARENGVEILANSHLRQSRFQRDHWRLQLQTGGEDRHLEADYLVEASGMARAVLRYQNIEARQDDTLAARIGVFQTESSSQDHRTLIEAEGSGWWYSTSAPGNKRVVMFFSDTDLPEFRACNRAADFIRKLETTRFIVAKLRAECPGGNWEHRMSFHTEPAHSSRAAQLQGERWIAIGDAAMSFDPLSSQGLWTGLQSAEIAADHIVARAQRKHASSRTPSADYTSWVKDIYSNYLIERNNYYAMEGRWANQEFWQRRRL